MSLRTKIVRRARRILHAPTIALAKRRYFDRVLAMPQIRTRDNAAGGDCEVHVLTYHRDWQLALWAIKSFYGFAKVDWPLVFHIGGPSEPTMLTQIKAHCPDARILSLEESDALVEPTLKELGRERLLGVRRRSVMIRKLVDSLLLSTSRNVINLDSDVLFFRRPDALLDAGRSQLDRPVFMRDRNDTYTLTREEVRETYGVELVDRLNAGLNVLPRALYLPLAELDELLADERLMRAPWLVEQTMHAVWCSRHSCTFMPEEYFISGTESGQQDRDSAVAIHYTAAPRPSYFRKGLPTLCKGDFLGIALEK